MGKRKDEYAVTSVLLIMCMASQINCSFQANFSNHLDQWKRGIESSSHTNHINSLRHLNGHSIQTTIRGVNQQKLKKDDLIKKMPGQPRVSFKQYGGYVAIDEFSDRFLYYYFVEAINANASTPLVIWFNGGPGCSSLQGAFNGHGPFRIHSDGKTLYRNPYSWNNEANMLYVESPTQVGFSYKRTSRNGDVDRTRDKITAEDNYSFLVKWLERFPEYKERDFFIAAQSYGGHYGPELAQIILNHNNQTFINLRGVLLGNPGLDKTEEAKGSDEYLVSHAVVTKELVESEKIICDFTKERANLYEECGDVRAKKDKLTENMDLYNIYSPICLNSTLTSKPNVHTTIMKYEPCSGAYLDAYLNMKVVQQAMHSNTTKLPYRWKKCHDDLESRWNDDDKYITIQPILHELMEEGVRVWVYSGDADAIVSVTSTMYALKKMNLTVEKTWRPWSSVGEVGGYVEEYKGHFTYATVRGGGHAVPKDQPKRALTLFTSFVRNTSLPSL